MSSIKDGQQIALMFRQARLKLAEIRLSALPDGRKEIAEAQALEDLEDSVKAYINYIRTGRA